jgi:AAA domain
MIPQQAMSNDPLSPHTPSPLPADADATVTGTDMVYLAGLQPQPAEWLWQHRLAAGTLATISGEPGSGKTWVALATLRRAKFDISALVALMTENLVPGGGLCRTRRMSTRRSTRQDAQINYLSTLSIFRKQTTYLATLPNPNLQANECHCF